MIFGMHPFHVFNTLFYLFWFVSHKFWQISFVGLQYKLQKLCFLEDKGIITTWNKKAEEAGKMAQKTAEQKRLLAFLEAVPPTRFDSVL